GDLPRFGVAQAAERGDELRFSLVHRPSPLALAPWMALVSRGSGHGCWDMIMSALGNWIIRWLDNPKLIIWIVEQGGHIHPTLAQSVESALVEGVPHQTAADGVTDSHIRPSHSKVRPAMRFLWGLVLSGALRRR